MHDLILRQHWADLIATHHRGLAVAHHLHDREAETWSQTFALLIFEDLNDSVTAAKVRASIKILDAANPAREDTRDGLRGIG